ncbi:hypothetical protein LZP73_01000 [Shewanella sp. AS16]|uniref:hypothetical protein n=1 Tax=Shewanella sp. AS16 TaxID=2907625 RepID=UPI001F3A9D7F|nr:hypothetical protein [Shewanella sp. AS16]MCE9684791.1 hypothetical protein [Shewanella sp. AS16]
MTNMPELKSKLRHWTLVLGVIQVTFGCMVGFIPPDAVQWFRGIVMAHMEFTANGVLMIVLGLLVKELGLGAMALKLWFVTLQLGTWTNGLAGLVGAFMGYSSKLMPTLSEKFPPPHGMDHPLVTGILQLCGVTIMLALLLTIFGLLTARAATGDGR